MDPVTPFDWHRMFLGEQPPLFVLEILFRIVAIYAFAVLLLRLMGKRGNRTLSPFENVLIIALGSAVGDAMFYPQVPILYAWVVVAVVVLLQRLLSVVQLRSARLNTFLESDPEVLVRHGEVIPDGLRAARLRPDELLGMLREQEVENTGEVRYAFLERSGQLGLLRYPEGEEREGEFTFPRRLRGGLDDEGPPDRPPAPSRS